jgi:type VI secretion system protein ImpG
MNREFLEFYDRELKILYERSKEFAEEFPGMAERLGSLTAEAGDPLISGLLEGAAFLAARVQLKLKAEFSTFTSELIEQLLPGFLAPTPSFAVVQVRPDFANPMLLGGVAIAAGQYVDTTLMEKDRRVACRYRLVSDVTVWPYEVQHADYFATAAPIQALGLDCGPGVAAGLRVEICLCLNRDKQGSGQSKVSSAIPEALTFYLAGPMTDVVLLYEQLFSKLTQIGIRYLNASGDPCYAPLALDDLQPVGFAAGESLFGHDDRVFAGFNHLREYFAFPAKYLGIRIRGLAPILKRIEGDRFDLLFQFTAAVPRLSSVTKREWFALYAAPASNLFEMECAPVLLRSQDHEHAVIPDPSHKLEYEVYRVLGVNAQYPRTKERVPVFPLYSAPTEGTPLAHALHYSVRRRERRRTEKERRSGSRSPYIGSETFISLREPKGGRNGESARTLSVRALVTNRHLTDQLPVRRGAADFFLVEDASIHLDCIAGPTPPRESLLMGDKRGKGEEHSGAILWKLISLLQFNHLGLSQRPGRDRANALQELLMVFADSGNPSIERQIRGILDVAVRPVVRKIRQGARYDAARGLEITVTLDENAFEGQGLFLFGLVLSRFFTEYATLNIFAETVILSRQRGIIKRWPPQIGRRALL